MASTVVLGGRKVSIRRPRVRSGRQEVPLPTFQTMAQTDPLRRRTVEQLLVGVSTRGYARSLEPLPADIPSRSVSKSAVSRRFVAKTASQLAAWQATPLDELDLVGLLLDGVHIGEHCVVVALGVGVDGTKHALGLWEGSTENATVCQSLLANLQSRGLRTDRSILVMLDGSKALRAAVTAVFGRAALVQRCQIHKTRNILDHLPERQRPWVLATLKRAYQSEDVKTATRLLRHLARRLDQEHPCAAASVREGLEETVTVLTLGLSPRLQRSLATTNAVESLISRTRHVKRNVIDVRAILELITNDLKTECNGQYISKYCEYWKNDGKDQATLTSEALCIFEAKWSNMESRVEIVPGKRVLRAVRDQFQRDHGITLTDLRIIDAHAAGEVPGDMVKLIRELEEFRTGREVT